MLEEQLRAEFAARLCAEVEEKMGELDPEMQMARDTALAEVMLGYIEESGDVTEHELCPHMDHIGRRRCRITAFALPDDSTRLELFIAHYIAPDQPLLIPRSDLEKLTGWAARFFAYAAQGEVDRFRNNGPAAAAAKLIAKELGRIETVRIHALTNGLVKDRVVDASLDIKGRHVEFSVWDLERLMRATSEAVTRDCIEIDFASHHGGPLSCLELKPPARDYQTFLLILPGKLLCDLYEKFGARLFEFNVRSFLQARGNVNKGIRDTIRHQPDRFLAYNNGLTATADEIEVGSLHGETVIWKLKGLQIVNGAQTTASVHWAHKIDKLDVSRVAIAMKLTRVAPAKLTEFVPSIARYANTQNPVQIADLSANSTVHIKLEHLSEQFWCPREESRWFYERARGAYQVARARHGTTLAKRRDFDRKCPKSQHFGKTDLAKYWMSWWQRPHIVSKGAQKNFGAFMSELRDKHGPDWLPDMVFYHRTIALALLFKAAQARVRRAKLQSYGANVVTYTIAKLAADHGRTTDLETIWNNQAISPELIAMFDDWIPQLHKTITNTAGSRNVTEWCKKDACWDLLKATKFDRPERLPPEIGPATPVMEDQHAAENDPIGICCKLDKAQWSQIMGWAAKCSDVDPFDLQVTSTIFSYAVGGWKNRPSEKQARRGVRVIESALRAGVLERLGSAHLASGEPMAE